MQVTQNAKNDPQDRSELNSSLGTRFLQNKKETFLKVGEVHHMPDFLMNLVSPEDQWMYITSNGALTAGRKNADNALFPYYTQDKLIDLAETTGCVTSIWKEGTSKAKSQNWKPFSKNRESFDHIERNVYKSLEGNEVIFEEINTHLGLQFSYLWTFSPHYGFARYAELTNIGSEGVELHMLDGLQNLVPYGLDQNFMNKFSNLSDAYKKSELLAPENVGVYYLSSIPSDRAEPSEGLRSTLAWSLNYQPDQVLLSSQQLENFEDQKTVLSEQDVRGQRCSYLLHKALKLEPGEQFQGWIVADINQDAGAIEELLEQFSEPVQLASELVSDIEKGSTNIRRKIASADGYQLTNDPQRCARHLSNVLFNIMRGGIFVNNYQIPKEDFLLHIKSFNRPLYSKFGDVMEALPVEIHFQDLIDQVTELSDPDLLRLTMEYLPLTFSRRHGDPSRPWNAFSIETTGAEGNPILAYEGNWRDIFQNWEALSCSYPQFLEGMIFRFLNASTAEGYNPYRVTKDGFEWEVLDPDEPWSNIGYWGDHQIIYLLKLLELSVQKNPSGMGALLDKELFVYANIPYRIANFEDIWHDPKNTVTFDQTAQENIDNRVSKLGTDGKLLTDNAGNILKVTLMEKLLSPLLAKLSNFVPKGGIWLNTQRPEWNDANNALVGNGLSVVTLGYLHRYLEFLTSLFGDESLPQTCKISEPIHILLQNQQETLSRYFDKLPDALTDKDRYAIIKELGEAGSNYRKEVYDVTTWDDRREIKLSQVVEFTILAKSWIAHSLQANRRDDGLYHSYNLMNQRPEGFGVDYLYEMLEGQVSILSSKYLRPAAAADLLDTLRNSDLYTQERGTYLLYPDRDLPRFMQKGIIDESQVSQSPVLERLLQIKDTHIVYRDIRGRARFNSSFRNVEDLKDSLDSLRGEILADFSKSEVRKVETVFEDTFQHHSFTGRSGTFFAYEGLGSIYWHMVSKLLLAIQETYFDAVSSKQSPDTLNQLGQLYFEILHGLGIYDEPKDYGAFPSDAYSHTPKNKGAQQPGMTGQVKEDILVRWGELGITISDSCLCFEPSLLRKQEFLEEPDDFNYYALDGSRKALKLEPKQLAFTYCQTPIVYELSDTRGITVTRVDGSSEILQNNQLTQRVSQAVFSRLEDLKSIRIRIPESSLLR